MTGGRKRGKEGEREVKREGEREGYEVLIRKRDALGVRS